MNRRLLLFLLLFSSTLATRAQSNLPQVIPPSPNAASLGIYGQIPVSLFSGLPQISIPLGNVTAGDISVPITLNYHGGGIRPEHHPGWAGLGWDLDAGGVITRKVNGGVDEILTSGISPETLFGYYYYYYCADFATWASADTLNYYRNPFALAHAYPAPDEFIFNFGRYSGSFFYNQKGKWQVRSADPLNLKVEEQLMTNYSLPKQVNGIANLTIKRIFYKFTLTTPDGTKYIFGGTPESIEFTRNSVASNTNDTYNTQVIATSWYLTSIISRKGQRIDLSYARDGIQAHQSVNVSRYQYKEGSANSTDYSDTANKTLSVINASYLTSIKAPNQTVNFARSQSNELPFSYTIPGAINPMYKDLSGDPSFSDVLGEIKWLKLDSISFYSDSANYLKKFAFYYRNSSSLRLTLDSLKEIGSDGGSTMPYQFFYDETPLPFYNSRKIDHWGFYNGHNYFSDVPKAPAQYGLSDITPYFNSRNSDTSLVRAGTLIKIKYPTGGSTIFSYEPHDFSKVARRYPFVVTDSTGNAGGLRIRKITNQDADGHISGVKQYLYVHNYNAGGTISSGILAGVPQYFDQGQWVLSGGTISYWFLYDVAVAPLSFTDGNHITYSEVVEKLQDGSYTIYNYSNHDVQSYHDESAVAGLYTAPQQWNFDPNTSRSLERGKLLFRKEYNASNVLLHKVKYDYDTSASRYSETVRMINVTSRTFGNAIDSRATAYLTYTFPRYLIRQTDSLWDQNGTNPLVTVKNMVYNTDYRQKTIDSTFTSEGKSEKLTYQYPFDLLSGSEAAIYQKMTDSNFIAPVIQSRKFIDTTQVNYTNTHYYEPFAGMYAPGYVDGQIANGPIDTSLQFSNYDNKGNILEYIPRNGIPNSFDWGYNQEYPIVKVVNAHNSLKHFTIPVTSWAGDVLTWVSGATDQKSITITSMAAGNISVEGHYNSLPDGKTYSFSYSLLGPVNKSGNLCASGCGDPSTATFTGMPAGTYTLYVTPSSNGPASLFFMISYPIIVDSPATSGEKNYFYDGFEENDDVHVVNGQAHTGNRYWSNNTFTTTFIPPDNWTYRIEWWSLSGGSWRYNQQQYTSGMVLTGPVDDIRICPANALMSTYTYQPMVGMTSEIDPKGFTTYYSYDPLGRLTLVRDKDNNIIKRYCYNLAGQQQSCPFVK